MPDNPKPQNDPAASDGGAEAGLTEMPCPTCHKSARFNLAKIPPHFPFCSMRCKTIDLGEWLTEDEDETEDEDDEQDS